MIRLADDLEILPGLPPFAFNVYVMGGVVVDAGIRRGARRLLKRLEGRRLSAHALTHAHPDHQGASRAICERFGLPLWCGEADAEAAEVDGVMMDRMPPHWLSRAVGPRWAGPPHPVARRLREGDEVGGFTVLETPGHTVGHIPFWREADRTLVAAAFAGAVIDDPAGFFDGFGAPDGEAIDAFAARLASVQAHFDLVPFD